MTMANAAKILKDKEIFVSHYKNKKYFLIKEKDDLVEIKIKNYLNSSLYLLFLLANKKSNEDLQFKHTNNIWHNNLFIAKEMLNLKDNTILKLNKIRQINWHWKSLE